MVVFFEVDGWFTGDGWSSITCWGNINDWGEGEGVLFYCAYSGGEGSLLRGGWGGGYMCFGMGFVVVAFVDYF